MNKIRLLSFLLFFAILAPSCDIEDFEIRYFDRIVIVSGDLSNWDLLTGPDLQFSYGINTPSFESEIIKDVSSTDLPLELFFVNGLEVTNDNWVVKIVDVDDLNQNDLLIETQFFGTDKTDEGNPFILSNSNITLEVYWKTR